MKNWKEILTNERIPFEVADNKLVAAHGETVTLTIEEQTISGVPCAYLLTPDKSLYAVTPEHAFSVFKEAIKQPVSQPNNEAVLWFD